jgi:hypothetical protein
MESRTLPQQQPAPAAAPDVDLTTYDNIQEVEPVPALVTKEELKATVQEYTVIDNRCWVWKHGGLLKTLTFSASQKLYSHVRLRCLQKNQSQLGNCLITKFKNQSSNAISHMKKKHKALLEVERGIILASTASSAAAAGRSALLNPKQASSSGSSGSADWQ